MDAQGENNGTAQGVVNYAPGAFGQGFSLDGAGYIENTTPTLNAYASAFSIAGWFVIDNFSGQPSLLDFRDGSNSSGFTLSQDGSGEMRFFIFKDDDAGGFTQLSSTGWQLGRPYFIAATFDGNTMTIYRDGSPVAMDFDPVADTMKLVTTPSLNIGRNVANGTTWDGQIDEVQFYDHSLTLTEVASLSPALTADFDDNGDVDRDDLTQWQGDFGMNDRSDADNDEDSDGADFLAWQLQVGGDAPTNSAANAVPEPGALSVASLAAYGLGLARRRRR